MESNKIGLQEFKEKVKSLKKFKSKHPKPKLRDVSWVTFRMLIDSTDNIVFNEDLRLKFNKTFESLLKLDSIQLNNLIDKWINKSYIYKKEEI